MQRFRWLNCFYYFISVAEKADFTHLRNLDEKFFPTRISTEGIGTNVSKYSSDSSSDENSDGEDSSSDDSKSSSSTSNSSSSSDDSENGESDAEINDASHYQHGDKIVNANQNIFGDKVSELKNDNLIHVISDDSRFTDSNDSNIQTVENIQTNVDDSSSLELINDNCSDKELIVSSNSNSVQSVECLDANNDVSTNIKIDNDGAAEESVMVNNSSDSDSEVNDDRRSEASDFECVEIIEDNDENPLVNGITDDSNEPFVKDAEFIKNNYCNDTNTYCSSNNNGNDEESSSDNVFVANEEDEYMHNTEAIIEITTVDCDTESRTANCQINEENEVDTSNLVPITVEEGDNIAQAASPDHNTDQKIGDKITDDSSDATEISVVDASINKTNAEIVSNDTGNVETDFGSDHNIVGNEDGNNVSADPSSHSDESFSISEAVIEIDTSSNDVEVVISGSEVCSTGADVSQNPLVNESEIRTENQTVNSSVNNVNNPEVDDNDINRCKEIILETKSYDMTLTSAKPEILYKTNLIYNKSRSLSDITKLDNKQISIFEHCVFQKNRFRSVSFCDKFRTTVKDDQIFGEYKRRRRRTSSTSVISEFQHSNEPFNIWASRDILEVDIRTITPSVEILTVNPNEVKLQYNNFFKYCSRIL